MTEKEYQEWVLAAFDRQFKANRLSQELVRPTAGSLKAEAVKVCSKRFDPKDERVLGSFMTAEPEAAAYLRAIQNCDYQIFKPLNTFLNNRHKGTTFKNIQLLAWLIDFRPRPFHPALQMTANVEQHPEFGHDDHRPAAIKDEEPKFPVPLEPQEEKNAAGQTGSSNRAGKRWLTGIAALLVGSVITWWLLPRDNCMYWNNDHYVAASCTIPRSDTPLIKLDPAKLRGFRRLHQVDTLTYHSVGQLWYVRVEGMIEVYSAEGKHPLYPNKKLAPLTYYAVNVCQKQHGY